MKTVDYVRGIEIEDRINLRLTSERFAAIGEARSHRPASISRDTWITESIQDQVAREARHAESQGGRSNA